MTQPCIETVFNVSAKLANGDVVSRSVKGDLRAYELAFDMLNLERESPVVKVSIRDCETGLLISSI